MAVRTPTMMAKPRCPVVGTDRDGFQTYCGKDVARWHGSQMRCKKHSRPGDREVTPYDLVEYDRQERLRDARLNASRMEHSLDTLVRHRKAVMATFEEPFMSVAFEDRKHEVIRTATVRYVGPEHEERSIRAQVVTYPSSTRSPQIKSMPRTDAWTVQDGGAYPTAMAMLFGWVAEVMDSARGDQGASLMVAIDKAEEDKVEADAYLAHVEAFGDDHGPCKWCQEDG